MLWLALLRAKPARADAREVAGGLQQTPSPLSSLSIATVPLHHIDALRNQVSHVRVLNSQQNDMGDHQ
jgi:hypothetical protein